MPRPHKPRWIGFHPAGVCYLPHPGIPPGTEVVVLTVDELEAIRLADAEGLSQEAGAAQMHVSRPTFGRIVNQARAKVAQALVSGRAIAVQGGVVQFHPGAGGPGPGRGRGRHGGGGRGRSGGYGPDQGGHPPVHQ